MIDLNLLYTFHVFVEAGGVSPAARRLGRSQPAISARLHQLEEELGAPLYQRVGRRLELTPLGRAVEEEARTLLAGAQKVLDLSRSSGRDPIGTLRVGSLPTVALYYLAPVVARYAAAHPGVEVELDVTPTRAHVADLLEGRIDLVVSVGRPPPGQKLEVLRLAEVTPVLVTRRRGAKRGRVSVAELRGLPLIGYGRTGDAFFDEVWDFLEDHGLDRQARVRVAHISFHKSLVAAGAGVSILPDYTVVEPELATRPIAGLSLAQPLWAAVRPSMRQVPLIDLFLHELRRS